MPLLRDVKQSDNTRIILWKIEEDISFFKKNFQLDQQVEDFFDSLNKKRKLEWICSRYLLQDVIGIDLAKDFKKDRFGKPYLDQQELHISISHSHEYSALAVSARIIGIDIQKALKKISRIAPKFIGEEEWTYVNKANNKLDYYHIIWGAKEGMYKGYGRKMVDFRQDMFIAPFTFIAEPIQFKGTLSKEEKYEYAIHAEKFDDFYFVVAKEQL